MDFGLVHLNLLIYAKFIPKAIFHQQEMENKGLLVIFSVHQGAGSICWLSKLSLAAPALW